MFQQNFKELLQFDEKRTFAKEYLDYRGLPGGRRDGAGGNACLNSDNRA